MTEIELEQAILELIQDIYKSEYIGKIKVQKIEPIGYCVKLGMNTPEAPLVIYAEIKEDQNFLKFMEKELKERRLDKVYYSKLFKTMPPECNVINRACSCNDK